MSRLNSLRELEHLRERLCDEREKITTTLTACGGTGCQASQSQAVIDALRNELSQQGLDGKVRLRATGCHGFCEQGPIVVIEPGNIFYCHAIRTRFREKQSGPSRRSRSISARTGSSCPRTARLIPARSKTTSRPAATRRWPGCLIGWCRRRSSGRSKPLVYGDAAAADFRPDASGPSAERRPAMRST